MSSFWEYCRDAGLANVVSVLALVVSVWAILTSRRANKQSQKAQARLIAIEESREQERLVRSKQARVHARVEGGRGIWQLIVVNDADAAARNLEFIMDDKPLFEHRAFAGPKGLSPPGIIGPRSSTSYPLAITTGSHPPFNLKIRWEDESGIPGSFETTLDR